MNILRKLYSLLADTGIPITSLVPGTGATNLAKLYNTAITAADVAVPIFYTRRDVPAQQSTADDRYDWIQGSAGAIWVRGLPTIDSTVTFSLDTSAYADGDLLADTQQITNPGNTANQYVRLVGIDMSDEDAQGIALDVVMLKASTSLGTENSAPNISDANLRPPNFQGLVSIAAADWKTISGAKVVSWTADGNGIPIKCNSDGNSFVALIARGAGTFTASGIVATFWFARD